MTRVLRKGITGLNKGEIISFGGYGWRVLTAQNGKVLLLCDTVIEKRAYHNSHANITWENCELRRWLNGAFLNTFGQENISRIAETRVATNNNPWFGTKGGGATIDRVFLLSIEEAVEYFGDSGLLRNKNPKSKFWINDEFDLARMAREDNSVACWWWLRSPGGRKSAVAGVGGLGGIDLGGNSADDASGGVRPALWLIL